MKKSELKQILRKSLLYKTKVEYGSYTINHVEGCSHGCLYPCYAMMLAKRFGKIANYDEWLQPKIVSNAYELLEAELSNPNLKIDSVHLCFTTDPFMYGYSDISAMSIRLIKLINSHSIPCTVLTKGVLPKKLTLLDQNNSFGITLISLNEEFRKRIEPFSAPYSKRISALKYLSEKSFKTWVSIEPYPTPNILEQDILSLLEKIKFVDKIIFGRMNYNKVVSQYKNHKSFFNKTAADVISFCVNNGIEYYIKNGTITE